MISSVDRSCPTEGEGYFDKTSSSGAASLIRVRRTSPRHTDVRATAAPVTDPQQIDEQGSEQASAAEAVRCARDEGHRRSNRRTALVRDEDRTSLPRSDDDQRLREELQALPGRSAHELKQSWQTLLGTQPPDRLSRDLLIRVIADKLQEATLGGLSPATKRKLAVLAHRTADGSRTETAPDILRIKAGTKLVRTWRGNTHTVLALENGFEHEGKRYASLTQIADEVTGAHWSGPRFFGLTKSRKAASASEVHRGS